jgi:hypothetical protein
MSLAAVILSHSLKTYVHDNQGSEKIPWVLLGLRRMTRVPSWYNQLVSLDILSITSTLAIHVPLVTETVSNRIMRVTAHKGLLILTCSYGDLASTENRAMAKT